MNLQVKQHRFIISQWDVWRDDELVASIGGEWIDFRERAFTGPELNQINEWFHLYLVGGPLSKQEE
jgi:hypothetical protein